MRRKVSIDSRNERSICRRHRLGGEDEAIDVAAEAHGVEAERPCLAARGRGRRREAVDGELLHARRIDVLHPAGFQIVGQRLLGRHADHVEPHRLAAAVLEAEHGLRGVVEGEARRRQEGEAELGMHEAAAAHEALARVLAIDHAVEVGEILGAVALAVAGPAELARIGERVLHALRRRRMGGEEVGARGSAPPPAAFRSALRCMSVEEARGAVRIEAGARGYADADAVGLEFLRAREARQRQLRFGERQRAHLRIAEHVADHVADERRLRAPAPRGSRRGGRSRGPSRAPARRRARPGRWRARSARG